MKVSEQTGNILYLSHGGGPLPLLNDGRHDEMLSVLKRIALQIRKPDVIILISAHWEAEQVNILAQEEPELLYDYYGFPEEAYHIEYPAKGDEALAKNIGQLLSEEGIESQLDYRRDFDHGMFIPLKIMYPDADIPCVQVSLLSSLNAEEHINLGRALGKLECENCLVIGSGFSFHNMNALMHDPAMSNGNNIAFENWLIESCSSKVLSEEERKTRLIEWEKAPSARYCHPREEHLLPLHVCYGVAGRVCDEVFELIVFDKKVSMYLW